MASEAGGERQAGRARTPSKPKPPRRKGASRPARSYWPLAVLALVPVLLVLGYLRFVYPQSASSPAGGAPLAVEFRGDETPGELAERLTALGLVEGKQRLLWYARIFGVRPAQGPHLLPRGLALSELVARLERRGASAKVVIPEGFTSFDIARRLEAEGVCSSAAFVAAVFDPKLLALQAMHAESFEGYLFPATYELAKDSDPAAVIARMKETFDKRMASITEQHPSGRLDLEHSLGWNLHEIVTLASMVEREAVVHEERPVIASVFLNRLRMPEFPRKVLQCDPTAGYGCARAQARGEAATTGCAGFTGRITPQVNSDALNRYSTYTHAGLPPGPIANPGAKSLAAVLNPATTRYLYFVARGEGRHAFSETYEAHQKAIHPGRTNPPPEVAPALSGGAN